MIKNEIKVKYTCMVQVKNMKQRSYIMLYFENDYCEGAHEAILKD